LTAATRLSANICVAPLPSRAPAAPEQPIFRIQQLPREAGWVLITAGVVGLAVPGVLGMPFLLAGAIVLMPGGSTLLSRWAGDSAMRQINRFLDDLERRYPQK
jgi:hypothetical protein